MTLHSAYAVKWGSSTVLSGLRNIDLALDPEVQNDSAIGSPYPQFVAVVAQQPKIRFATSMLASTLAVTGVAGAALSDVNTLVATLAKLDGVGLPAAGSVHRTYTATRGLLLPRRLSASHRQRATLDCEALLHSTDGETHPIAISDTQALPSLAVADIEHTLGPISLGLDSAEVTIPCVTSLAIDFGNGAQTRGCESNIYDTHVEQPGIRPVITITGLNATAFGDNGVPPVGKKFDHAHTAIYLRKRDAGIGFVADATAEHIKLTAHGVAVVTQHTGQGTAGAEVTLMLYTSWDGTNAAITIDTASILPADGSA